MSPKPEDGSASRYVALSRRLGVIGSVAEKSHVEAGESEADTLAHALVDIDETCRQITSALMPRLFDASATDSDVLDTLTDLGERFRELLYHIRDPTYFRYLPGCEYGNDEQ